jgi:hypothetical protein
MDVSHSGFLLGMGRSEGSLVWDGVPFGAGQGTMHNS